MLTWFLTFFSILAVVVIIVLLIVINSFMGLFGEGARAWIDGWSKR